MTINFSLNPMRAYYRSLFLKVVNNSFSPVNPTFSGATKKFDKIYAQLSEGKIWNGMLNSFGNNYQ